MTRPFGLASKGFLAAAWLAGAAALAQAQSSGTPVVVRVRVVDSARAPIANADISLVRGLNSVMASGTSDASGVHTFHVAALAAEFQIVVRRVGYTRKGQFASAEGLDSVNVDVILARAAQQLAAVNVTAPENVIRRTQYIDEDAIAASDRPLVDALDIVLKLRPDMVWGHRGTLSPRERASQHCEPLSNLWVNGRRIRDVPPDDAMAMRQRNAAQSSANFKRAPTPPLVAIPLDILSILGSIKPEHVEAMEYHDCSDFSVQKAGGSSAMFVVLKPGVEFEPGLGTFVPEPTTLPLRAPAAATATAQLITQLEPYRTRILGVFDEETGAPLAAVDVTEVATGTRASTSETGTVSLAFVRDGGGSLALTKAGYRARRIDVVIAPTDTLPVSVTMRREKQ